jgi:hypothetical protein
MSSVTNLLLSIFFFSCCTFSLLPTSCILLKYSGGSTGYASYASAYPAIPGNITVYICIFEKKREKNLNARPIAAGSHAMLRVPQVEDHDHVMGGPCGPRSPAATAMFTLSPAFQAP